MSDENDNDEKSTKLKKPGCLMYLAILGAAALSGGTYLLTRWETLNGIAKASAILLVVFGAIALVPPLIVVVIGIVAKALIGKFSKGLNKAALEMVQSNKGMYGAVHEFRAAEEEDFEGLSDVYYEQTKRALEEKGFRHLGDVVDSTIEEQNGISPPIRVLASVDGATQVGIYHVKLLHVPSALAGRDMLMCDVSTEFSDGTFLLTSNTQESDLTTPPPRIQRRQHPLETTPLNLVAAHDAEKEKLLAAKPGVDCVRVSTLDDALESEKRQQEAKNAFRKEIGYVDPEEVGRIADGIGEDDDDDDDDDNDEFADAIKKAVDEARKKERGNRDSSQ
jgi:hypothetical protein